MRKIVTTHVYPPIPIRQFDWQAHYDGEEDERYDAGHGSTEAEAVVDLIENYPRGQQCTKGSTMKTARFWHYHKDGAVRIALKAGQSVSHAYGGPTDEGWHREWTRWEFDGNRVVCESGSDGADCDGRLSSFGTSECTVDKLKAGYVDNELGIAFPAWEQGKRGQRDYSAEAMGY